MDDYKLVITHSKKIEKLLEEKFSAVGRGLHEKVTSVESAVPDRIVRMTRYIATIRNGLIHDESISALDDRRAFEFNCFEVTKYLSAIPKGAAEPNVPQQGRPPLKPLPRKKEGAVIGGFRVVLGLPIPLICLGVSYVLGMLAGMYSATYFGFSDVISLWLIHGGGIASVALYLNSRGRKR